jgi:CRISPR-associated endonuclease/helicase Cas3
MDKIIYAHSANDKGELQPLNEHLTKVADMASKFTEIFASSDWAYNIGILHDLGKISADFQEKKIIKPSEKEKIDHSTAGAVYAVEKFKDIGRVIAYCVAGHHAGLADWNSEGTANAALSVRLKNKKAEEILNSLKDYKDYVDNNSIRLKDVLVPPKLNNPKRDLHLWIRMLYSCLVDADFLNTEKHFKEDKFKKRAEKIADFDPISKLSEKFFDYMSKNFAKKDEVSAVNKIRSEVLMHCEESSTKKEGFWELSAPTGSGKTLSSMAFAFKHAVKFNKERIIYVIPYTSIIEQTSDKLKEILGGGNVIEHHSNIDTDKETEEMRFACENWDAPIIVTTHVQFFESLYAAKSSRCRKLHNVVNSIIILDEVQMLPPNLLEPCVDALKQLVNNYKTTVLFSTATQPALPGIDKIEKIIPDSKELHDRSNKLKGVNYVFPKDYSSSSWESVCEELKNHRQVLCVVNTRKDCYELYNKLTKLVPEETVIHLSALMCPEHRTKKIDEIKEKLKEKAEVRVISTQLVEAGVDIDFPVVYRAFAGIPSIIQTAGRCNREGKLKKAEVFIFMSPSKLPQGLLSKAADVTRNMIGSENFQIDKEDTSRKFYEEFYKSVNSNGGEWLESLLIKNACDGEFQFSTAAKEFQIIDDKYNRAVIVKYGESDKLIDKLRCSVRKHGKVDRELQRKLQRYTVNVPDSILTALKNKGLVEEIHKGIFIQGQIKYSDKTGLNIFETDIIDLPII